MLTRKSILYKNGLGLEPPRLLSRSPWQIQSGLIPETSHNGLCYRLSPFCIRMAGGLNPRDYFWEVRDKCGLVWSQRLLVKCFVTVKSILYKNGWELVPPRLSSRSPRQMQPGLNPETSHNGFLLPFKSILYKIGWGLEPQRHCQGNKRGLVWSQRLPVKSFVAN